MSLLKSKPESARAPGKTVIPVTARTEEGDFDPLQYELRKKFDAALKEYIAELGTVRDFYESNKHNPPISRYHPPVAGRIWWVRSLFYAIKKSIVEFREEKNFMKGELATEACNEYLSLAKEMRAYEETWYKQWSEASMHVLLTTVKAYIFIRRPATTEYEQDIVVMKDPEHMVMKVNLPLEITETIHEAIHMEQLGHRVHERITNIALLRDTLTSNSRLLQQVLDTYYGVRRKLRAQEADLTERVIKETEKNFEQGLNHLTWAALGVPDYAKQLTGVIQKFEGVVIQVNTIAKSIRIKILELKFCRLFQEPPYKKGRVTLPVLDCWDYFKYWEKWRNDKWGNMVGVFEKLTPMLIKLESLTYGTSNGRQKRMHSYYMYWEKCLFNYLAKVVIRTLNTFEIRMNTDEPLFDIDAVLTPPEIRTIPSAHEVFQLLAAGARDIVEGTKRFVRWRRGTCIPVTPIKQAEGEHFLYTFYTDIGRLPRVLQLLLQIQDNLQTIMRNLWQYLKLYREFKNLWLYSKEKTVESFAAKNPSVKAYNEKMAFYTHICKRIMEVPPYRIEGCVRLNVRPLQTAINQHARDWVMMLGKYLQQNTEDISKDFAKKVLNLEHGVRKTPRSVTEFKRLLDVIQSIYANTTEMEICYRDLMERHAVMRAYDIQVPDDQYDQIENIWKRWQNLRLRDVKVIEKKTVPLKKRYNV